MRIIGYSMLFHILVFDFDHSSCLRERIPKETAWYVLVVLTFFQIAKNLGVFTSSQMLGNYFKCTWKSKESEKII